eukprot:m.154581 g.154581  ORF g.154581 m.154581 type:complete len:373 (+) comp13318_c0_seq2:86-1204(+)
MSLTLCVVAQLSVVFFINHQYNKSHDTFSFTHSIHLCTRSLNLRNHALTPFLQPLPLFSWCSTDNHFDIVLPTYKMTKGMLQGKDLEKVQKVDAEAYGVASWDDKKEVAFFRGRPSNEMRVQGMLMSKEHPDMLDIRVTKNQFNYFPDEQAKVDHRNFEKKYGPKANLQPISSFFKYKYLLSIDGTVAAYRLGTLLAGNSVIFKQESDYYEHFYNGMKPFVHYVPINRNLSDLLEKVNYARDHDNEMRRISQNAREFTRKHLRMPDVYCYHFLALQRYASLQTYSPLVPHDMEEVIVEKQAKTCQCPTFPKAPVLGTLISPMLVVLVVGVVTSLFYMLLCRRNSRATSTNHKNKPKNSSNKKKRPNNKKSSK